MLAEVRSGSDSAVATLFGDSSCTPETGHGSARLGRQKSANSRREQVQQISALFDHLIGASGALSAALIFA
jgi:hypothetical protein